MAPAYNDMCPWAHSSVVQKSNKKQKSICVLLHMTDIDCKTGNSEGGSLLPVSENMYTWSLYKINRQILITLYHTYVYVCVYIYAYVCVFMYTGISIWVHIFTDLESSKVIF